MISWGQIFCPHFSHLFLAGIRPALCLDWSSHIVLVLPCGITQYHPHPDVLPLVGTRLSNLSHIWQLWGFPLARDAEQPFRTTALVRGHIPWLAFWDSHQQAAKSGMGTFKAVICRDIPNLGAGISLLSWMELSVLHGVGDERKRRCTDTGTAARPLRTSNNSLKFNNPSVHWAKPLRFKRSAVYSQALLMSFSWWL